MRVRHLALLPVVAGVLTSALALFAPATAAAEKLPVDCSGRRTSCFEQRTCSRWDAHQCVERTTEYWYWYYGTTTTP